MEEKATEITLNKQFKHEARNRGVDAALDVAHKFNAEKDASSARERDNVMEGMASNRLMLGYKGGFGWRPNRNVGRRTVTSTATRDGARGLLDQVYYDGELVSETFKPTE